jgi:ABC-type amino acid transport substrate-binding protein
MRPVLSRRLYLLGLSSTLVTPLAWQSTPASGQSRELRLSTVERNAVSWVAAQLMGDICREAGLGLRVQPMPASRASLMSTSGQLDGELIRISTYNQRYPQLLRVDPPFYQLSLVGFSLTQRQFSIQSKDDLKRYTLGMVRGLSSALDLTEGHPAVTLTLNPDLLLRMLQAGRFDVAIETLLGGLHARARLGPPEIQTSAELVRYDLHLFLHERHRDLLPRLGQATKSLRASGELERLTAFYEAKVQKLDLGFWAESQF